MKALTIQQPWADAIAFGAKRVENRTWDYGYTGILAVHAGKTLDRFGASPLRLMMSGGDWDAITAALAGQPTTEETP